MQKSWFEAIFADYKQGLFLEVNLRSVFNTSEEEGDVSVKIIISS